MTQLIERYWASKLDAIVRLRHLDASNRAKLARQVPPIREVFQRLRVSHKPKARVVAASRRQKT